MHQVFQHTSYAFWFCSLKIPLAMASHALLLPARVFYVFLCVPYTLSLCVSQTMHLDIQVRMKEIVFSHGSTTPTFKDNSIRKVLSLLPPKHHLIDHSSPH